MAILSFRDEYETTTVSDIVVFVAAAVTTVALSKLFRSQNKQRLLRVNKDNEELAAHNNDASCWHRAVTVLVFCDPPEIWYEPKEWSHTTVLLCRDVKTGLLCLPLDAVRQSDDDEGNSSVVAAARLVKHTLQVDVTQPENSLHRMFTFPKQPQWIDFMECVYRGNSSSVNNNHSKQQVSSSNKPGFTVQALSLEQIKEMVQQQRQQQGNDDDDDDAPVIFFTSDTYYALLLYFQRQMDLRAKRRLLKGYSSVDLEHYGLRSSESSSNIVFTDDKDTTRMQAVEFTMKTDDGMHPKLLFEADVVLLGVSRAGKTPLSLILSQSVGFKVANVPLVVDVPPPPQLFKVNPRRVFCLTVNPDDLMKFRTSRLHRELRPQHHGSGSHHSISSSSSSTSRKRHSQKSNTYADRDYIARDLEHARKIVHDHGFTEINVSGRAIEETAGLIASKIRERFPEQESGLSGGSWHHIK